MGTPFSFKIDTQQELSRLTLAGEITEDCDFKPVLGQLSNRVAIDLKDVSRINSCGVREWINFVGALAGAGKRVTLERCSVPIVQQLNMISNFRGNGQVLSVYAPYYCQKCDAAHAKLVDLGTLGSRPVEEQSPCPTCGQAMDFDDIPESYLSFHR